MRGRETRAADVLPLDRFTRTDGVFAIAHIDKSFNSPCRRWTALVALSGGRDMQDILIRIETDDFAAWAEEHYLHAGNRVTCGIEDG